jgi:hypothetical protein
MLSLTEEFGKNELVEKFIKKIKGNFLEYHL